MSKDNNGTWTSDGQVFIDHGYGWGVKEVVSGGFRELKTVCLGSVAKARDKIGPTARLDEASFEAI